MFFLFPLLDFYFCFPPPPHHFSNGPPLTEENMHPVQGTVNLAPPFSHTTEAKESIPDRAQVKKCTRMKIITVWYRFQSISLKYHNLCFITFWAIFASFFSISHWLRYSAIFAIACFNFSSSTWELPFSCIHRNTKNISLGLWSSK